MQIKEKGEIVAQYNWSQMLDLAEGILLKYVNEYKHTFYLLKTDSNQYPLIDICAGELWNEKVSGTFTVIDNEITLIP